MSTPLPWGSPPVGNPIVAVLVHILPLDRKLILLILLIEDHAEVAARLPHVFMRNRTLNSPLWPRCSLLSEGIEDFTSSSLALIVGRTPCSPVRISHLA